MNTYECPDHHPEVAKRIAMSSIAASIGADGMQKQYPMNGRPGEENPASNTVADWGAPYPSGSSIFGLRSFFGVAC